MMPRRVGDAGSFTTDAADRQMGQRAEIERVLLRAHLLPAEDRALLLSVYDQTRTPVEVAALIKVRPRDVRRRIRSLARRLTSDLFMFVVRERDSWPAMRRQVATGVVLQGLPLRRAATQAKTSVYHARQQMVIVHALFAEETAERPAA